MKLKRIVLSPEARGDLERLSEKVHSQVIAKIKLLRDFPYLGPPMFDAYEGFRCLLAVGSTYRIIYRIKEKNIEIVYIRHTHRQLRLRPLR